MLSFLFIHMSGMLDHMVGECFNFLGSYQTIFQSDYSIFHFHQQSMRVPFALYLHRVSLFNFSFSDRSVVIPHFGFNLISLLSKDVKYLFLGLFNICIYLDKVSVQIFLSIWIGLFVLLSFESSLCILDTSSFLDMWFSNIFLPVCGLFLHSINSETMS